MRVDSAGRVAKAGLLLPAVVVVSLLLLSGCAGGSAKDQPALAAVQANAARSARGDAGSVLVQEAWIAPPPGRVYPSGSGLLVEMVLVNNGSSWDSLTSVSSPDAARGTVSQYGTTQDFISLPTSPRETQAIAQLSDTTRTIAPGSSVPVTFQFASAGSVTLQVPVRTQPRVAIGSK